MLASTQERIERCRPDGSTYPSRTVGNHAMELAGRKQKDEQSGEYNQQGPDGLLGYMLHLALNNENLFCQAFASKLLPLGIDDLLEPAKQVLSEDEVQALCLTYGIPFERAAEAEIRQAK
jgi:hypothetical protein